MARLGKYTKVWVGGYALTPYLSAATPESAFDELEVSPFLADHRYLAGQADGTITIDGYFEDSTNVPGGTEAALAAIANGTAKIVTVALGNNATPATGDPACSLDAQQVSYTVQPVKDGVVAVNAVFKSLGNGVEWGTLLLDASITDDGQGSTVDQTAQSTAGAVAYFHQTALSSGDVIDSFAVNDSDDNFVSDDNAAVSSTLDGSAIGAERVAVTGTIERYVRADYTVTGASISFPLVINFIRL